MKAFETPQFVNKTPEHVPKSLDRSLQERISEHSAVFDKNTAANRIYSEKEIREAWKTVEWRVGETTVQALGVHHTPETFLEFREVIEKAIQESDIVINEFAPEAQGFYDSAQAARLSSIPSRFNDRYNLEQLRQIYIRSERLFNIGAFHHEVEILAAKHGKDMAVADLSLTKDPEAFLQDSYFYADRAEEVEANQARLKRMGVYGGATAAALGSLWKLLQEIQKPLSRRNFLRVGLTAAGAAALGRAAQSIEIPESKAWKVNANLAPNDDSIQRRDIKLAQAIQKLSARGYKKIAFIYGVGHLNGVGQYLSRPEKLAADSAKFEEEMRKSNPDSFRVYRLSPGQNTSEKFTASPNAVWKRIAASKEK